MPSGWNEVPVRMFQELSNIESENGLTKVVDLISILSDKDPEEIRQINSVDLAPILEAVKWTGEEPGNEHKIQIAINGVEYYLHKLSGLSLAEWIDLDNYANDVSNMHKFFAMLYRPAGDVYSVQSMLERAELFLDKLMIQDAYGSLLFFLSIAERYSQIILASTKTR